MEVRPEHAVAVGMIVCDLRRHGETPREIRIGDHVLTGPELHPSCAPKALPPRAGELSRRTDERLSKLRKARVWLTGKAMRSAPVRKLTDHAAAYAMKVRPYFERNPELVGERVLFEVTLQNGAITTYPMFVPDADRFATSLSFKRQTLWSLGANAALGVPFGWIPATGAIIPGLMALWNGACAAVAALRHDPQMRDARKAMAKQHALIAVPAALPYGEIAIAGAAAAIHKRQLDHMKQHGPQPYFAITGDTAARPECATHTHDF